MSGAAQKYSSMTSKTLGSDWSKKVQMYIDAQAEVTGQQDRKSGFRNKAGTGPVPKAMKENDEAKPKWYEDAEWQYDLFEQYNGRPARDDDEIADWLMKMIEVQKTEGVDYKTIGFRNWIENKIIMKRAMGESIASALLGESIVAWHASPNKFRTFDTSKEGAHFGSREQAENLRKAGLRDAKPYRLELINPLRVRDMGTWTVDGIATELHVTDVISDEEADQIYDERNWSDERGYAKIKEILAGKGYDGFVYENEQEGPGDSYVAFYSRQIKPLR